MSSGTASHSEANSHPNSLTLNHPDLIKERGSGSVDAAQSSDSHGVEDVDCDRDSLSSSGSFHSTVESLDEPVVS